MRNEKIGPVGWILLMLLVIPIPVLAVMFIMQVCT